MLGKSTLMELLNQKSWRTSTKRNSNGRKLSLSSLLRSLFKVLIKFCLDCCRCRWCWCCRCRCCCCCCCCRCCCCCCTWPHSRTSHAGTEGSWNLSDKKEVFTWKLFSTDKSKFGFFPAAKIKEKLIHWVNTSTFNPVIMSDKFRYLLVMIV